MALAPEKDRQPAIVVDHLTARYGDQLILENVNFTVSRGEVLVVAGGSGSGKSTLLRHMIGLEEPATGRVVIEGVDVHTATSEDLEKLLGTMGVLFQSGALLGSLTLGQNVALPISERRELKREEVKGIVRSKLAMVGLTGYENHLPSELSGGMKKRAGLARALVHDPAVLFFDEPSAGLDPVTSAELDQLILRLNRALGNTMVIVTHELDSIYTIAERVIMLDKEAKGIIAVGEPHRLREQSEDPRVLRFFHRQARE